MRSTGATLVRHCCRHIIRLCSTAAEDYLLKCTKQSSSPEDVGRPSVQQLKWCSWWYHQKPSFDGRLLEWSVSFVAVGNSMEFSIEDAFGENYKIRTRRMPPKMKVPKNLNIVEQRILLVNLAPSSLNNNCTDRIVYRIFGRAVAFILWFLECQLFLLLERVPKYHCQFPTR